MTGPALWALILGVDAEVLSPLLERIGDVAGSPRVVIAARAPRTRQTTYACGDFSKRMVAYCHGPDSLAVVDFALDDEQQAWVAEVRQFLAENVTAAFGLRWPSTASSLGRRGVGVPAQDRGEGLVRASPGPRSTAGSG